MSEKVIGYVLLTIGILLIVFAGFSVYNVFKGNERPYKLFTFDSVSLSLDPSQLQGQSIELPQELQDAGIRVSDNPNQKPIEQELLPSDILNDTSNVFAHLMLMGFVASVGFKFASLGTQMVRPIVIKASSPKTASDKDKSILVPDENKGKTAI